MEIVVIVCILFFLVEVAYRSWVDGREVIQAPQAALAPSPIEAELRQPGQSTPV